MATAAISNRRRKVLLRLPLGFLLRAGVIFFPQYVPSRHTQKAGIGCYRPPFGLRKAQQLFHGQPADFARIGTGGAGMVENVAPAVVLNGTLAKVDHTVIRLRAGVLAKEQQVARHGGGEYAADQMRVQVVERPHVGELSEGGGVQVRRLERPFAHAKQRGAQGRKRILILGDGIERRRGRSLRGGGPGGVVGVQRFAIGVADQAGAILDLGRAGRGRLEVLRLGEPGEPAAEGMAVAFVVEAQEVGRAVLRGVPDEWNRFQFCFGGGRALEGDAQADASRQDAGANARLPFAGRAGYLFDYGSVPVAGDGDGGRAAGGGFHDKGGGTVGVGPDPRGVGDEGGRGEHLSMKGGAVLYPSATIRAGWRMRRGAGSTLPCRAPPEMATTATAPADIATSAVRMRVVTAL